MSDYNATIAEAGNGFPDDGDLIGDVEAGIIYRIKSKSRIHTGKRSGQANYVFAVVEPTDLDWGDVSDDELSDCALCVDDDEEEAS